VRAGGNFSRKNAIKQNREAVSLKPGTIMSDENPFANWPHIDAPKPSGDGQARSPATERKAPQGVFLQEGDQMTGNNAFENFLGGSPATVFVKLLFVSLVVGALLMWLDIRPADILRGVQDFVNRIYALGFGAVRELFNYLLAGAVIVVPAWFILRVLSVGSRK
jgi:hypothetical protein